MENLNRNQIQGATGSEGENGNENSLSIRDLVFMVINNWYWFVVSVVFCLAVAAVFYKTQPKTYSASGTILVRDNGNNVRYSSRNMDAILNNMGMDNSNLSLENEIYMLRSSWLMSQVVVRLGLDHSCTRNDLFKKITYFNDAPLKLTVNDKAAGERELSMNVKVTPRPHNKYEYKASRGATHIEGEAYYSQPINLDDTVQFKVERTTFYNKSFEDVTLNMGIHPVLQLARSMIGRLTVSRVDKMASILSISFSDANQKRANQIVDTLIAVYNDDAVDDKNKVAQKTYASSPHLFIDKWDTPILCIHGERDYRILANQAMSAFDAAIMRGVPAELLIYPDENHWVLKPQNGILWQRTFFEWLDKWLK